MATIAVIGGTGKLGKALAKRYILAGHRVILGSRDEAHAQHAATELQALTNLPVTGMSNYDASISGEIILFTVPYAAQNSTLQSIRDGAQGKIVIIATVPLRPPKVMKVQLPEQGSAAQEAQSQLGENVIVTSAFHNLAAHKLELNDENLGDVLVFSDDKLARNTVASLASDIGLRGIEAGPLANSAAAEALTSVLIFINKHYGADGAGIFITGINSN